VDANIFSIDTEQLRAMDTATIERMRQTQESSHTWQMQTFVVSNNINTSVRMDYMGLYVESTIEVHNGQA